MDKDQFAGMTIREMKKADPQRTPTTLDRWEPGRSGIGIGWNNGICASIAARHFEDGTPDWAMNLKAPVEAIIYGGTLLGDRMHGIDIKVADDVWIEVFYETPLEQRALNERELADLDRRERERYEKDKPQQDELFRLLPPLFQRRIQERRDNNPNFRLEWESYEGFACQQAVRFAEQALLAVGAPWEELDSETADNHLIRRGGPRVDSDPPRHGWRRDDDGNLAGEHARRAVEWLQGWQMVGTSDAPGKGGIPEQEDDWAGWEPLRQRRKDYDHQTQRNLMPGFKNEHSGNTFHSACHLARLYLVLPEGVYRQAGVGAPIVGSDKYGDPPPQED